MLMHLASAKVALPIGLAALVILFRMGRHRNIDGTIHSLRIVSTFVNAALLYTLAIALLIQIEFEVPLSEVIRNGVGETRMTLLLIPFALETFGRLLIAYIE